MATKPSPRMPVDSVEELYDKLRWEEDRLVQTWSVYDSWNFVLTAHHLYKDWIGGKTSEASAEQKHRREWIECHAPLLKQFFVAIGNVADGSKHFELSWQKNKQLVDEVLPPGVSDYDAYFLGDMVEIRYDGYRVSMAAGSAVAMECLNWIICGGDPVVLDRLSSALAGMKVGPVP